MILPDTNQVQQIAQTAAEIKTQISPYLPALAVAAAWAGRELRNLNASLLATSEWLIAHGGMLMIARKLIWNPSTPQSPKP